MQTGLNLVELAQRIEANRTLKHDLIADSASISMAIDSDKTPALVIDNARYGVLETAHDQIGSRLGIPAKYYDRMRSEAPQLLANNVNEWFARSNEKRMVRTLGGDARALLSNKYQRIENEEIAEVTLPILGGIPDVQFVSTQITERRMYIQAVTPRIQAEVKKGDVVQAGVIISNSEIGMGAVSIRPIVYRLACLNGMVIADSKFTARHVGARIESIEELLSDEAKKADDKAILLKVRDIVRAAVEGAVFHKEVERLMELTTVQVTGHPEKVVEVLARKVGANETEKGGLLRSLISGGDLSAWGLVNAVTHQAHSTAMSYDRAVEFETMGGNLVNLPRSEWREILEAA
jgi:hypothetical protein